MITNNTSFRFFFLTFWACGINVSLFAQENSDSVILRYLRTKADIPAPFLKIEKKDGKTVRSQNYFSEPGKKIEDDSLMFRTFLFGSSASHSSKYFLIEVKTPHDKLYKIFDDDTLEAALKSLFIFLQKYHLSESIRAQIVNQLSFTYY